MLRKTRSGKTKQIPGSPPKDRGIPKKRFPEGSAAALLHFGNEASREGLRSRIKTTQPKKRKTTT